MKRIPLIAVAAVATFLVILFALQRLSAPLTFTQEGIASWYGPGFEGDQSASGAVFHTYDYVAAHKTLPLGSIVRIHNIEKGYATDVRIIDRGPFVEGRIIDLSRAAAQAIAIDGTARVRLEGISRPRNDMKASTPTPKTSSSEAK